MRQVIAMPFDNLYDKQSVVLLHWTMGTRGNLPTRDMKGLGGKFHLGLYILI